MPVPLPQNNESVRLESGGDNRHPLTRVRLGTKMPGAWTLVDPPHPAGESALFGLFHPAIPRAALTLAISATTSVRF